MRLFHPTTKTRAHVIVPLLLYASLTAVFFWPLVLHAGLGLHDRSDTTLNTWIIAWEAHILTREPLALFNAPIFYPLHNSLALSEIIWPAAPLAVPLLAASGNPVLVYNLLFLGSFLLAGLGAYALALHVTRSRPAAWVAGVLYAFSPHQFGHLSQLQLLSIGWLPLVLLFLERFWARPRPRQGALLACAMAAQALSAFYYAFQVVLVAGLYLLFRLCTRDWRRNLATAGRFLAWGALAAALIVPFTIPYLQVRAELGLERSLAETLANAPPLTDYLLPSPANPVYQRILPAALRQPGIGGGGLFLGLVPAGLALIGLLAALRGRKTARGAGALATEAGQPAGVGLWLLLLAAAAVLSLGPRLKLTAADPGGLALPFGWLYQHLPGMTAIRAPGRFGVTVFLSLAVLSALGLAHVLRKLGSRSLAHAGVGVLAAGLCLIEYAGGAGPFAVQAMPDLTKPPAVYAWLAAQPRTAIVELPLTSEMTGTPQPAAGAGTDAGEAWPDYNLLRYQYFGTVHWQPSLDGYSGFTPPHHRELGLSLAGFPSERSLAGLRGLGARYVVVHSQLMDAFQPGRAAALRAALAQTPAIEHVEDFGPDWVYEVLPAQGPQARGQFWVSPNGSAFLRIATPGSGSVAFSPDRQLHVREQWQEASSGRVTTTDQQVALPLLVSGTSVTGLPLALPKQTGTYTLTLDVVNAPLPIDRLTTTVAVKKEGAAGQERLLALRLTEPALPVRLAPGSAFTVTLAWRLLDRPLNDASVSVQVQDAKGQSVAQDDHALSGGRDLVRTWQPGQTLTTTHRLTLPAAALGRYALRILVYRPGEAGTCYYLGPDGEPQAETSQPLLVKPLSPGRPARPSRPLASFDKGIALLDAQAQPPAASGEPFAVSLAWTAAQPLPVDYTVFAHLVTPSGELLAQQDQEPRAGRYPTSVWEAGEQVTDTLEIQVPPRADGETACLRIGLYDANTLTRLARRDAAGDFWQADRCWPLPR